MSERKASIKETGEELSQEQWARFDAAVADEKARRPKAEPFERNASIRDPREDGVEARKAGRS